MSDNIAITNIDIQRDHLPMIYPDTETDKEKERESETRIERHTYTRTISYNIAEHWEKYSDKKRQTNTDQETYKYTYKEW